ncbi:OmpA family protein [Algoriphagus halophytocola]|uniref:OmpA family protein n=1 Tax=Algoriphagus halophytocola TaxID=2991499 RepID=UPI0022DD63D3|nr:OmpA family protein [Algoriphagus sp. TR-M9]WBL44295.1 OmpA family protein [Algoriphagus sp. TR-M9]
MKKLSLLIIALAFAYTAEAQLHGYKWRFGLSAGTTNYLGDIRPIKADNFENFLKYYKRYENYSEQLSYQLSIEYALGNSVGLMLSAGSYQFGSGDRFVRNDGTLFIESPDFDRALNFQTDLYDAGLSFVIKPDNNWLLSGKSFFAPYITLGAGVQTFKVMGDLLDANGNQYDYTNTSVIPDGSFETNLTELNTELSGGYKTTTLYANLGLGFRFRITKSIELFAQSDFKRAATDYLDDVSGVYRTSYDNSFQEYAAKPGTNVVTAENPYRGMENGRNDWYIYHGIGVKFSLGANKESFKPPVITQRYTYVPTELSNAQLAREDSLERMTQAKVPVTNNYFTVIQLPANGAVNSGRTELDSATMEAIQAQLDSLQGAGANLDSAVRVIELQTSQIDETLALAQRDSTVSEEVRNARISNLENEKNMVSAQMDSLNEQNFETQYQLDSLNALMNNSETSLSKIDSASLMNELIIYPGQVSRIIYSANGNSQLTLDSASQAGAATYASRNASDSSATFTREQFDEELSKFRNEMLQAQATRDSAMMMAFATKTQYQSEEPSSRETEPQEFVLNAEDLDNVDDKTAKKIEKNRKKQEKLDEKNNELLRDALLVGGTAATTAAISNSGEKKEAAQQAAYDSALLARIERDSILIDSLQRIPVQVDTVIQEKQVQALLHQSKIDIYFGINEATIGETEKAKLERISEIMAENPEYQIELIGFADNTGSVAYNLNLVEKRVDAVYTMLTEEYQLSPDRIGRSSGGLIMRGKTGGSVDSDRKVEIQIKNQ